MAATIEILVPDKLVEVLGDFSDLPNRAVEALVAQAYRAGKIAHAQAGEILGLDRWQTDAFLKIEQAHRPGDTEEFASDLAQLRGLNN